MPTKVALKPGEFYGPDRLMISFRDKDFETPITPEEKYPLAHPSNHYSIYVHIFELPARPLPRDSGALGHRRQAGWQASRMRIRDLPQVERGGRRVVLWREDLDGIRGIAHVDKDGNSVPHHPVARSALPACRARKGRVSRTTHDVVPGADLEEKHQESSSRRHWKGDVGNGQDRGAADAKLSRVRHRGRRGTRRRRVWRPRARETPQGELFGPLVSLLLL